MRARSGWNHIDNKRKFRHTRASWASKSAAPRPERPSAPSLGLRPFAPRFPFRGSTARPRAPLFRCVSVSRPYRAPSPPRPPAPWGPRPAAPRARAPPARALCGNCIHACRQPPRHPGGRPRLGILCAPWLTLPGAGGRGGGWRGAACEGLQGSRRLQADGRRHARDRLPRARPHYAAYRGFRVPSTSMHQARIILAVHGFEAARPTSTRTTMDSTCTRVCS